MEKTELNHGMLDSISYDDMTRELHVHFKNGDYTIFYEVSQLDYVGFLGCKNYSDYFQERIEPRFPSKKITS
ncbi:KTSC domain-containing protein [Evansella caseinilytica]|uniref:KTSC domain-containing protein n=1 Tax=Evansella caseinilytica TaxID=1503961 RepID=A0A1H3PPT1_9BACI|nr:KTSC domain-containing protein [Evansella caseinilytica]SDZ03194.1 KTSC domain-containing protein [Evansella caseinilytica]